MISRLGASLFVLDSWPVLEWIKRREPAFGRFNAFLKSVAYQPASLHMTRINYGEVLYSIRKAPEIRDSVAAIRLFESLSIVRVSIDDGLVDEAVELKSRYAFAYADAFAAALAIRLGVPLATGDKEFRPLEADGLLQLEWLGA